ncbi:unnamed protein product [Caenorhabditis brenneri]
MPRGVSGGVSVVDGYAMHWRKSNKDATESLYHCVHRGRRIGCPASYAVHIDGTIRIIRPHERHEKDSSSTQAELARQSLKVMAKEQSDKPRNLIHKLRQDFNPEAIGRLGDYYSMRKVISNVRRRENTDKINVNSGKGITGQYAKTNDGSDFLIIEKEVNSKPFALFASESGLKMLRSSNFIFADGSFDASPDGYTQIFTIHGYISESVVRPLVFALLGSKEQVMYAEVLAELKKLPIMASWNPSVIVCDFEKAIRNAFTDHFPGISIQGCLFHLIKAWRKKATDMKIYSDMLDGGHLNEYWKLLKALPFIDCDDTREYFELIKGTLPTNSTADEFSLYLQKNYISGNHGNSPMYPPETWSCLDVTLNEIHRTTNSVEVWHRLLSPIVTTSNGFHKILLSELIDFFKREEEIAKQDSLMLRMNPSYRVTKSRLLTNVTKDRKLQRVLANNPIPPNKPLAGIPLLRAIMLALTP